MDVSIIYVNYKTGQLLIDSICSVKEHTKDIEYEIIVVDNASEDGSVDLIRNAFPEAKVIESSENLGFGRANNLGVSEAQGKKIFFLNPDTVLINNAVKILSDYLDDNPKAGVCGGNLIDGNKEPANSFSRSESSLFSEFLAIFYFRLPDFPHPSSYYYNFTEKPLKVKSIIGADLMVKKQVLEEVGTFDPDFFMNGEEEDLCSRIRKHGYEIFSVPAAKILHYEGRSSYVSASRLQLLNESHFVTYKKKYGEKGPRLLYRILWLKCIARQLLFTLLRMKIKRKYWKNKRAVLGIAYKEYNKKSIA